MRVVKASLIYFAIVFGCGFALGTLRTIWVVPRIGVRSAELLETPIMLVASIFAARWTILRLNVASTRPSRLMMGGLSLAFLLSAEFGFASWIRGLSIREYLTSRDPVSGTAFYVALGLVGIMPLFVAREAYSNRQGSALAPGKKRITLIQGHPDPVGQHYCHALAEAYLAGAREAGHMVDVVDLAQLQFPLLRSRKELDGDSVPEAVVSVQAALTRAQHVVLIFPLWNGTGPAFLRGFLEQLFRADFVFPNAKPGERLGFFSYFAQRKGLCGRSARIVITMQMPSFVYRFYFRPHPERNSLSVAGLRPIRESVVGLVESPEGRRRGKWLKRMRSLGRAAR